MIPLLTDRERKERSRQIIIALTASRIPELTVVQNEIRCPLCDAPELNEHTGKLNIRCLKVMDREGYWWSHCLPCDHWF